MLKSLAAGPPQQYARENRIAALVGAIERLSAARSLDEIIEIVRLGAREIAGADGVTFVLREGNLCHYAAENAISPLWAGRRFPMSACISGWCMLNGSTAVIGNIYDDARIPHDAYRLTFVRSLVMVPIRVEAPLGAIGAYWARAQQPDPEAAGLLESLARSTATAFANVQLLTSLAESERAARRQLDIQHALIGELDHRVRNTLAVVQAVTTQTLRAAQRPSDFVEGLEGRLQALALSQDLVARTGWVGADLEHLVAAHLGLAGNASDDRVRMTGPSVMLEAAVVEHLGLIVHELGDNARRHGALSAATGQLAVEWATGEMADAGRRTLTLVWSESGGPAVLPRSRIGFGSRLVEQGLRHLGGRAELSFASSGVGCRITLPVRAA